MFCSFAQARATRPTVPSAGGSTRACSSNRTRSRRASSRSVAVTGGGAGQAAACARREGYTSILEQWLRLLLKRNNKTVNVFRPLQDEGLKTHARQKVFLSKLYSCTRTLNFEASWISFPPMLEVMATTDRQYRNP